MKKIEKKCCILNSSSHIFYLFCFRHYVVRGPEKSPYEGLFTYWCLFSPITKTVCSAGGYYHGKLMFPREFPFKPPSIYIITPNGRFKVNTRSEDPGGYMNSKHSIFLPFLRLCLSISDFHPDTWNPAWSVATILTGLLSFMVNANSILSPYLYYINVFINSQLEKAPTLGSVETSDYTVSPSSLFELLVTTILLIAEAAAGRQQRTIQPKRPSLL